jgi:molybdopterin-guanine dinucleotide biosynthesis protein A
MTDPLPAVILAGGHKQDEVAAAFSLPHKALVPVAGKPTVGWVAEALLGAELIGPVVVATELAEVAAVLPPGVETVTPGGDAFLDTIAAGFAHYPQADKMIVVTCDLPLLTPAAVDDFTRRALDSGAELCYSIVRAERLETGSTATKRTLVKLADGACTGGNITLLSRHFVEQEGRRVTAAFAGRKNPVALARLLGLGFIWGLLRGTLTIPVLITKAERIMRVPVAVIDSAYPEVCFDVDKVEHVGAAEKIMSGDGAQAF